MVDLDGAPSCRAADRRRTTATSAACRAGRGAAYPLRSRSVNRSVEPVRPTRFEPSFNHEAPEVRGRGADRDANDQHSKGGRSRVAIAAIVLLSLAGGGTLAARRFLAVPRAHDRDGGGHDQSARRAGRPRRRAAGRFPDDVDGRRRRARPRTARCRRATNDFTRRRRGRPALAVHRARQGQGQVASGSGSLQVRTEPAGARISVDGVPRGVSPVTVAGPAAGRAHGRRGNRRGIDEADRDR